MSMAHIPIRLSLYLESTRDAVGILFPGAIVGYPGRLDNLFPVLDTDGNLTGKAMSAIHYRMPDGKFVCSPMEFDGTEELPAGAEKVAKALEALKLYVYAGIGGDPALDGCWRY